MPAGALEAAADVLLHPRRRDVLEDRGVLRHRQVPGAAGVNLDPTTL